MSIIIEQTLPYTNSELELEDPTRWSRLFPLMRPSIKVVETSNSQPIMLDVALAKSRNVLIAAIGSVGNFSSKILSASHVAAFTAEPYGKNTTLAEDIVTVLKKNGFQTRNGVVVVRTSSKQDLRVSPAGDVVEVVVVGELKLDHVLSMLAASKIETK